MSQAVALIVDDEPDIRELLEITLGRMDIRVESAVDLRQARDLLAEHDAGQRDHGQRIFALMALSVWLGWLE